MHSYVGIYPSYFTPKLEHDNAKVSNLKQRVNRKLEKKTCSDTIC